MDLPMRIARPNRFTPNTFDNFKAHSPRRPYGEFASDGVPFPINDPFGLRRAVIPVFRRNPDSSTIGMGTAFHVDGWGRLLTADHVVDHIRTHHLHQIAPDTLILIDITQSTHAAVLLGYGLVFGRVGIPKACWGPIAQVDALVAARDKDPIASLQGKSLQYQIGPDIAGMSVILQPGAPPFHAVAVNFRTSPKVGETVFAVGYPELGFETLNNEETAQYFNEGMYGVYGQVTNLYSNGRDRTRASPGFEVEADWPPGMSGGPVFNQRGEVIGVVSSSLQPGDGEPGIGYATSLAMIPNASALTPTLDIDHPGCRLGFGVYRQDPWSLSGVFRSRSDAQSQKAQLSPEYRIGRGSHRLGSDEFILSNPE